MGTDDQLKRAFTLRLRAAFAQWGGTQTELAQGVRRSQGSVSDWLTKGAMPDGIAMLRLPRFLKVSDAWLISGEGSPRRAEGPAPDALLYIQGGRAVALELSQKLREVEQRLTEQADAAAAPARSREAHRDDRHAAADRVARSDAIAARKKPTRRRQA